MSNLLMQDKIVLITGATDGIGKQTAKELAAMGARVVLVGRNKEKCEISAQEVIAFSKAGQVDYLLADLSSMGQVRQLADDFKQRYDRLDVLMNNAGGVLLKPTMTEDGYERTFALNHLAYFLLTDQLLDLLKASAPSRIVNTSSNSHVNGKIHFENVHIKGWVTFMERYAQSKLANVMFTYALSRRLEGTGVTANCLHPGLVETGIFSKAYVLAPLATPILTMSAIPVEEGADTMVYLASAPEVDGVTGKYFYKRMVRESAPRSYDIEDQERLWQLSQEMVKKWA